MPRRTPGRYETSRPVTALNEILRFDHEICLAQRLLRRSRASPPPALRAPHNRTMSSVWHLHLISPPCAHASSQLHTHTSHTPHTPHTHTTSLGATNQSTGPLRYTRGTIRSPLPAHRGTPRRASPPLTSSHARRAALSHTRVRLCTRMHASATAWACCAPRRRRAPLQSGAHMLAGAAIAPRLRHAAARRDEWCSPAQCHSRRWSCGRRAACRQR